MFPRPYQMAPTDIFSGGQQFGTLPNPSDGFAVGPLEIAAGGIPEGVSPFAMQMLQQYRANQPQPGRVEYDQQEAPPPPPGFGNPNIQGYMMGRYLNNSQGVDRNMRMREQRVNQSYGDDGVDRFFSRVVAPIAGGAAGAMGHNKPMAAMQQWQGNLNQNIQRNRQYQAAHINDYQQNQQQAFNQAAAMDPNTQKNQMAAQRAYYYGLGVQGRNTNMANKNEETKNYHAGILEDRKNRTVNQGKDVEIRAARAQTYAKATENQRLHLTEVDKTAARRADVLQQRADSYADKIEDDIKSGAVDRTKGLAQIEAIYDKMEMDREKLDLRYDEMRAGIMKNDDNNDMKREAEAGKNLRAANQVGYSKDGTVQPKMDEGFRAQYGKPLTAAPQRESRGSNLLDGLAKRKAPAIPQRPESNGLVPPPPAEPMQRRGGGVAQALADYRKMPESQRRVLKAMFIAKYGRDPDAK